MASFHTPYIPRYSRMQIIYKLFRTGGDRPQSRRVANSQGLNGGLPYEKSRTRLPPSKGDWTCKHELYRYPIEEAPEDPWERCYDVVDRNDEELCKDLKDEISYLLVVASLFLAIVTAFTVESVKSLQGDNEKATVLLLGQVVRLLNNSSTQGTAQPIETRPTKNDIVVNQLWFLSMTLSLSAVVIGTLCLQWVSAFRRTNVKHQPHQDALALRQLRFEGLIGWGVTRVPAILLLTVQGALVLFAVGLLYFLWSANMRVAIPVTIVSGVSVVFLALTTLMPLLQSVIGWIIPSTLVIPQCPYKSPISWVVHRGAVLLSLSTALPFSLLPPFRERMTVWRKQQFNLLTDYLWQEYDELWRHQRESRGPQASKTGTDKYSFYLSRGLASAMETLVFQPSAVHIIHRCLQEFHGTSAEVETFEDLLHKSFNPAEGALLAANHSPSSMTGRDNRIPAPSQSHLEILRRDFLNAHALQHFVAHNQKLHRILLPHRVELYVRIKNSSQGLELSKDLNDHHLVYNENETELIGSSIECPIQSLRDAQGLSSELRFQFLRCADRLIGTEWFGEGDMKSVEYVLYVAEDGESESILESDEEEPSTEDRFKRVLEMLEKRLSVAFPDEGQSSPKKNGASETEPSVEHYTPPDPNERGQIIPPSRYATLCRNVRKKLHENRPIPSDPRVSPGLNTGFRPHISTLSPSLQSGSPV
ncbi:hypothetical protein P691DRAFT_711317 [Macrolepiota fuliginosa MF-IS2]|uniref:DUF6535 domain-containing protein n=1 Tax=Macrolepiota fuliginosa MF-IS2 TaxID=1400762 RepID=A0A9P5X7H9_9AGAR|nr:hypothetical protein P691DRAFT_711317 [Macrolepiota fuliginosa MF-IS2]